MVHRGYAETKKKTFSTKPKKYKGFNDPHIYFWLFAQSVQHKTGANVLQKGVIIGDLFDFLSV